MLASSRAGAQLQYTVSVKRIKIEDRVYRLQNFTHRGRRGCWRLGHKLRSETTVRKTIVKRYPNVNHMNRYVAHERLIIVLLTDVGVKVGVYSTSERVIVY